MGRRGDLHAEPAARQRAADRSSVRRAGAAGRGDRLDREGVAERERDGGRGWALIEHPEFGPLYAGPVDLPDGRIAYVNPITFGRAQITVGDKWSVDERW